MNKRLDLELLQGSVDLHIHSAPASFAENAARQDANPAKARPGPRAL